jgi:hypothetical protein
MKKIIFTFIITFGIALSSSAQDVYNYVLESSTRIVNIPTSNFTNTRIAQFKRTALIYMKSKALETMPEVTAQFLDTQAYYLSEFVTLFFNEILKENKDNQELTKSKIQLFIDASFSNPLFNDPDTETTHSYIMEEGELTPFCLDTDWMKAHTAATVVLKELKKLE